MPLESQVMSLWNPGYEEALVELYDELKNHYGTNPYNSAVDLIGGPYSPAAYPDVATQLGAMVTESDTLTSAVSALAPDTNWGARLTAALTTLTGAADISVFLNPDQPTYNTQVGVLMKEALKESYKNLITAEYGAGNEYVAFTSLAKSISETMANSVTTKSKDGISTNADALDEAGDTVAAYLTPLGASEGADILTGILANASITRATASTESMILTVHRAELTALNSTIKTISLTLVPLVNAAFTNALTAASTALTSAPINDMVEAFEDDILPTHMRSVNRIASGFSDINAVNSSAFAIGMVLLENDFQKQVNKYRTEVSLRVFEQLFPLYVQTYTASLNSDLQIITNAIQARIDTVDRQLSKKLEVFLNGFTEYMRTALTSISELSQTQRTTMASQGQLYQSILVAQLDSLKTSMTGHVGGFLNERSMQKGYRNTLLSQDITESQQQALVKLQALRESASLQAEVARISHQAYMEAWKLTENYVTESRIWPWKRWQYLANAVAAAGSGTMIPDKPSQMSSMISGILSGGLMGAKIASEMNMGDSGKGWTAAAGAVLGGLGGYQG